ncbi:MAG TPA: hypothetical protein VFU15_10670, partial [Bacteroidia bacterium]|nr:hypothetical protein [Bacteroidia bacterium]
MQRIIPHILFSVLIAAVSILEGCTAIRVGKGQVMLKKVIIKCENPDISKDEIYGYLKQKPNRKLFGANYPHLLKRGKIGKKGLLVSGSGFPFYLCIYNLVNPVREKKREDRRDARYEAKKKRYENAPIKRNGHRRKEPKKRRTIGEFLRDIGEAPVVIDSSLTARSHHQLTLYLDNKGYFNSTVKDTLIYPWLQRKKQKKGILCYIIVPSQPYKIRNVTWDVKDPNVDYDLLTVKDSCLIRTGNNYDVDVFEAERDRITKSLRNNGYYLFTKDFIRFSIDSTLGTHQMDVTILITRPQIPTSDSTWKEVAHRRFYIDHIIVKSLISLGQLKSDTAVYDTLSYNDITILRNTGSIDGIPIEEKFRYKPDVLASRISFRQNIVYRQSDYEATYRQLTDLRVFRQVVINPETHDSDKINIVIELFPYARQSFTAQTEVTNTGGNLGFGGSFGYQNNNLFHGAEVFNFLVKGGTEAQQTITAGSSANTPFTFNTIEFGAQATLNIPRDFFPFNVVTPRNRPEDQRKAQDRRTVFTSTADYQHRIDYDRSLGNLSYGYTFRYKKYVHFGIYPVEINVVKVNPRPGLAALLENRDPLLLYRFTDHLIQDSRLTYVLNTKDPRFNTIYFLRFDMEASGNIMRYAFSRSKADTDATG